MREEINNMKEELQFIDWESRTFGAGYGTGELPIMQAVCTFFKCLIDNRSYDYKDLEKELGETVTWLLINAFNKANMIEWGTSARFGWLTSSGEYVRRFVKGKTSAELYEILMSDHESICMCDGEMEGHDECGKNPMVNEKLANELLYKKV